VAVASSRNKRQRMRNARRNPTSREWPEDDRQQGGLSAGSLLE
jgi:hypothetical protein